MFRINRATNKHSLLDIVLNEILKELDCAVKTRRNTSIMLTGGRVAKKVYSYLASEKLFTNHIVDFYFGDERCVLPDDPESNYGMVMNTLFSSGIPENCTVHRIVGEAENPTEEAIRYATVIPDALDIILLSVGEDGHIASIFPGSETLSKESVSVCHVSAPKAPTNRYTITPKVLHSAKKIIVLACGVAKGKVIARALKQPKNTQELPITLVMAMPQTTIFLDKEASEQLQ